MEKKKRKEERGMLETSGKGERGKGELSKLEDDYEGYDYKATSCWRITIITIRCKGAVLQLWPYLFIFFHFFCVLCG